MVGVWICGFVGFYLILVGIALSFVPPGDTNVKVFLVDVIAGTVGSILIGLFLYWRGARRPNSRMTSR